MHNYRSLFGGMHCGDFKVVAFGEYREAVKWCRMHCGEMNRVFTWEVVPEGVLFTRKADPIGDGRRKWPFRWMEVGDKVSFNDGDLHKIRTTAHMYGHKKSPKWKFKTRVIDDVLYIERTH